MKIVPRLDVKLQDGKNFAEIITLTKEHHNLTWENDGKLISFELDISPNRNTYYIQFNWWGMKNPIISQKGILVESGKYFKINKIGK